MGVKRISTMSQERFESECFYYDPATRLFPSLRKKVKAITAIVHVQLRNDNKKPNDIVHISQGRGEIVYSLQGVVEDGFELWGAPFILAKYSQPQLEILAKIMKIDVRGLVELHALEERLEQSSIDYRKSS